MFSYYTQITEALTCLLWHFLRSWEQPTGTEYKGYGMVSAGSVVEEEAQKKNGTDTKLTHTQTHAHTCPDRHML